MLKIVVPPADGWDEEKEEFVSFSGKTLMLEHSLVSVAKWEAKWHKPFLDEAEKSNSELTDYVRCMTLTQNVDPDVYSFLTEENFKQIDDYINDSMTATWFNETKEQKSSKRSTEKVTSELVYYWMIAFNIPMECQKWHFNRLMTLIRICEIKNEEQYGKHTKTPKSSLVSRYASLNAARRKAWNTKG